MANPVQLSCFVAMAFDHSDTDAAFEQIEAVLVGMGIKCVRVDRIEHNDDIDDKIVEQIEAAHFVIADLTYARPSVYFEAGYAQRAIPVIYTARSDHFRARDSDKLGNERVHFDLQMRNIIGWKDGAWAEFSKRLKKRVCHVTKPLIAHLNASKLRQQKLQAFASLSNDKKIETCRQNVLKVLHENKYVEEIVKPDMSELHTNSWRMQNRIDVFQNSRDSKLLRTASLFIRSSFEQFDAESLRWIVAQITRTNLNANGTIPKAVREDYFVCTLQGITRGRIQKIFPSFAIDSSGVFVRRSEALVPARSCFEKGWRIIPKSIFHPHEFLKSRGLQAFTLTIRNGLTFGGSPDHKLGGAVSIERDTRLHFLSGNSLGEVGTVLRDRLK